MAGLRLSDAGPRDAARSAGLRWVSDAQPGIRRLRAGKGFRYVEASGRPLRSPRELSRIRALAIPPAWREVWICPHERGHLQATGRDKRGRKQYRYHPRWREARDRTKYGRLLEFGCALPRLREGLQQDLARRGLPREKVLAAVLRLLEKTLIRVGNEEYARANRSYGLTTLGARHVEVRGSHLRFRFRGKGGKVHELRLRDAELGRIVRRCQQLPGRALFKYVAPDGRRRAVGSAEVNDYLRRVSGRDFTAKDFRTWAGTVRALWAFAARGTPPSRARGRRAVREVIAEVARRLGNTPAICRQSYVHPAVVESYLEGSLRARRQAPLRAGLRPLIARLQSSEAALLRLLAAWRAEAAPGRRPPRRLRAAPLAARRARRPRPRRSERPRTAR